MTNETTNIKESIDLEKEKTNKQPFMSDRSKEVLGFLIGASCGAMATYFLNPESIPITVSMVIVGTLSYYVTSRLIANKTQRTTTKQDLEQGSEATSRN